MSTPNRRIKFTLLLIGISVCIFQSCLFQTKDERVAGGAEDFPNTVAMGAAVSGHISDHAEWDQFSIIPTLPSFSEADSMVTAPDSSSLTLNGAIPLKASAATAAATGLQRTLDTLTWDLSDTATLSVARRVHVQDLLLKVHSDTTIFRFDEKAKDTIVGNELILESKGTDVWKVTGRVQAYRYENLDSAAGFDRASFFERMPALGGAFRNKLLVVVPGPDGDINTKADNRPAYFGFAMVKSGTNGDTTESFEVKDADGDGALWGAGDSGLVDFRQKKPNPALRPSVALVTQKMRGFLFKDEQKTYPISFTETRTEKDGKQVVFSIRGTRTDSIFEPGDTAWISVHVTNPPESRLVEKHSRYRVILGSHPKDYLNNRLLRYTLEATWRKDSLVVTRLTFTPDQPVASKELSLTGDLEVSADFANEETVTATGRFEDKHIDVDLIRKLRDGKIRHLHIRWDALGKLLSQSRLD